MPARSGKSRWKTWRTNTSSRRPSRTSSTILLQLARPRADARKCRVMKQIGAWTAGVVLLVFAAGHILSQSDDFRQFYRAADLARTHERVYARPSFSPATNAEADFLPYNRIPSYALALQ